MIPLAAGAALLVAAPTLAASAEAQPYGFGGQGRRMHAEMGMHRQARGAGAGLSVERLLARAEELGLSAEQQTKLRDIRKQGPGALMPKRQAVEEARIAFQDRMAEEKSSATDLERAHGKLVEARTALQAAQFHLHMQVRDVLTPEQRTKLREKAASGRDGAPRMMRQHRFGAFDFEGDDDGDGAEAPVFERF
jgi:Spy/CpxP family protein refolding chaperone